VNDDPKAPSLQWTADGFKTSVGTQYRFHDDGEGGLLLEGVQDVYSLLEYNKACFTENSGWTWDKSMRRCATIPHMLRMKWLLEEGWDAWKDEHADALKRKLNDPEYRYLRTAEWRV
jgi:hypothetical protein